MVLLKYSLPNDESFTIHNVRFVYKSKHNLENKNKRLNVENPDDFTKDLQYIFFENFPIDDFKISFFTKHIIFLNKHTSITRR